MTALRILPAVVPIVAAALAIAASAQAEDSTLADPIQIFTDNCAACHQPDGKGIEGAFPALAGDKFVIGPAAACIKVVLDGRAGMPSFRSLSDAEIAAALTHVRTSWGNRATPVAADQVAKLRGNSTPVKNSGH